jgi:RNA polymerase sigma-70 factor (ECF subfamily)
VKTHTSDDGRDERFRALYQKYFRRMVKYYMRVFHLAPEDAEELAQEAFVRFYEAMDEYRGEAEWAFFETIARRLAYNRVRSHQTLRRNADYVDLEHPKAVAAGHAAPQYSAFQKKMMHDAIAALVTGQRQCVQLWLDGFTYDEIARALRTTAEGVRSRLRDARKLLRARLGDGVTFPEEEE